LYQGNSYFVDDNTTFVSLNNFNDDIEIYFLPRSMIPWQSVDEVSSFLTNGTIVRDMEMVFNLIVSSQNLMLSEKI